MNSKGNTMEQQLETQSLLGTASGCTSNEPDNINQITTDSRLWKYNNNLPIQQVHTSLEPLPTGSWIGTVVYNQYPTSIQSDLPHDAITYFSVPIGIVGQGGDITLKSCRQTLALLGIFPLTKTQEINGRDIYRIDVKLLFDLFSGQVGSDVPDLFASCNNKNNLVILSSNKELQKLYYDAYFECEDGMIVEDFNPEIKIKDIPELSSGGFRLFGLSSGMTIGLIIGGIVLLLLLFRK